ncbi:MAG TPA: HNH endonuclease, partial [Kribbella sp.]|nr:HNH endonuclease [Kribbella sp.]
MDKAPEVMTEDELVCALDQTVVDIAGLETRRLRLIAALDKTGHAERVGARDTRQFLEYRYRLDHYRARRDVQLARALPKYPVISAHLAEVKLRPAQAEAIVLELEKTPSTVPVA